MHQLEFSAPSAKKCLLTPVACIPRTRRLPAISAGLSTRPKRLQLERALDIVRFPTPEEFDSLWRSVPSERRTRRRFAEGLMYVRTI